MFGQSSDRLSEQKSGVAHHYISIQLDGTSVPSAPISIDRVGLTYFEVDFYKAYNENGRDNSTHTKSGFEVPVVFDVSVQRYSKFIRPYSTVCTKTHIFADIKMAFLY